MHVNCLGWYVEFCNFIYNFRNWKKIVRFNRILTLTFMKNGNVIFFILQWYFLEYTHSNIWNITLQRYNGESTSFLYYFLYYLGDQPRSHCNDVASEILWSQNNWGIKMQIYRRSCNCELNCFFQFETSWAVKLLTLQ